MYECFAVSQQGPIAHIQLTRPEKRNSMIASFWTELNAIVDTIDREAKARAIVISSTGPHFSSGMDLSVFDFDAHGSSHQAANFYDTVTRLQRTFTRLEQCRIPVLVAVQGGCIGAGLDFITACDCRYATKDAYFTIFETNLAMTADVGTFPRICKLMPDGVVRELAYTGRAMSADEAKAHGLLNQIFDTQEQLVEAVMDLAGSIASKAPMAIYGCKRMILHARDHRVTDTLDHVALWNSAFFHRQDFAEAMTANAEKRPGEFTALNPLPRDHDLENDIDI